MTIPRIPAFVPPMAVAGAVIVGHLAIGPEAAVDGTERGLHEQRHLAKRVTVRSP